MARTSKNRPFVMYFVKWVDSYGITKCEKYVTHTAREAEQRLLALHPNATNVSASKNQPGGLQ